jgi:tetratricopeptide (TPR) repeat protein
LDPASAEARNNLGLALLGKGAFADALPQIRAAIALRPHMPQAYFNLGRALKGTGAWRDALAALRTAVAQAPSYAEAWCELATVQERCEDSGASIAACERALALRPDFAEAWVARGDAFTCWVTAQAIACYRAAVERARNWRRTLSVVAALLGSGEYAEGWQYYESRSDPTIPGAVTPPMLPMPMWQGEDISGKRLLVHRAGLRRSHSVRAFRPALAERGIRCAGREPEMSALSSTLAKSRGS